MGGRVNAQINRSEATNSQFVPPTRWLRSHFCFEMWHSESPSAYRDTAISKRVHVGGVHDSTCISKAKRQESIRSRDVTKACLSCHVVGVEAV